MSANWNSLPEELQLTLSREALHRAAATIAGQAELLADEMECGNLADRGGTRGVAAVRGGCQDW